MEEFTAFEENMMILGQETNTKLDFISNQIHIGLITLFFLFGFLFYSYLQKGKK